jgi:hypothetical protein
LKKRYSREKDSTPTNVWSRYSSERGMTMEHVYDETTREKAQEAYEKTSRILNDTYNQAVDYGRNNPGKVSLIAFGAGLGVGILVANSFSQRRGRFDNYAEPVINALSQIASNLMRGSRFSS